MLAEIFSLIGIEGFVFTVIEAFLLFGAGAYFYEKVASLNKK